MKIIISGRAAALDSATKQEIAALDTLKNLDGVVYEEQSCCDYLDTKLDNIGLIGGLLRLSWDAEAKQLRVVTEYQSPRMLKPGELKALVAETTGQWSDGIGENYFWENVRPGITLDLSPPDQRKDINPTDQPRRKKSV